MNLSICMLAYLLAFNAGRAESLAPVHIDTLLAHADFVGIVQITSGILERGRATYKGKVIALTKGDSALTEIEFGRFSGLAIGENYLVFLSVDSSSSYQVMFGGLGQMLIEFTHLIQDIDYIVRHPIPDKVVKIATRHVILPKSIETYSVDTSTRLWSHDKIWKMKWARVDDIIVYLKNVKDKLKK